MGNILRNDLKLIIREPFLILMLLVPILAGGAIRLIIQHLDPLIPMITLKDYDFIMTPFIVLFVGMMFGTVVGFMLLDEKDENTLIAMFVTPYGKIGYLLSKVVSIMAITLIYSVFLSSLLSLNKPEVVVLIGIALIVALEAPMCALVMVTLAKNKVEGLALMKLYSLVTLLPVIKYFLPRQYELLFIFNPYYWPIKIFEAGALGESVIHLVVLGGLLHLVYIVMLLKKFEKQVI